MNIKAVEQLKMIDFKIMKERERKREINREGIKKKGTGRESGRERERK